MKYLLPLLFLMLLQTPLASAGDAVARLCESLDAIFSDPRFEASQWGVEVYALDRMEILYEKNANKLLLPASNAKIITASAALLQLGPDYRFKTEIHADGPILKGMLQGDLRIVGFGDFSSSPRIPPGDPSRDFRLWAARLKQEGVSAIAGSLVGDASAFAKPVFGKGWEWDDLNEGYAAPVSALQFNENLLTIKVFPGPRIGAPPSITANPSIGYPALVSELTTVASASRPVVEAESNRSGEAITLRGRTPIGKPPVTRLLSIKNPLRYYLLALKRVLSEEGIDVSGCSIEAGRGASASSTRLLWTHYSAPLSELLPAILQQSLNLPSETLLRVLGLEQRREGSAEKGCEVVGEVLQSMSISENSYACADGSGLSRRNLASSSVLVRVLRHMYRSPQFALFYGALPAAGDNGTLETRMKGTAAAGNVRAKTGTLTGVSAISGYVQSADGEMIAFSIIANNFLASARTIEEIQDKALGVLAAFTRTANEEAGIAAAKRTP